MLFLLVFTTHKVGVCARPKDLSLHFRPSSRTNRTVERVHRFAVNGLGAEQITNFRSSQNFNRQTGYHP